MPIKQFESVSILFQVTFAQQLFNKVRVKRGFIDNVRGVSQELLDLWNQVSQAPERSTAKRFQDPFWRTQWYMVCCIIIFPSFSKLMEKVNLKKMRLPN